MRMRRGSTEASATPSKKRSTSRSGWPSLSTSQGADCMAASRLGHRSNGTCDRGRQAGRQRGGGFSQVRDGSWVRSRRQAARGDGQGDSKQVIECIITGWGHT